MSEEEAKKILEEEQEGTKTRKTASWKTARRKKDRKNETNPFVLGREDDLQLEIRALRTLSFKT